MSYLFSYTKPPTKEITLLEFQNLAKKRIKIYDCLERDAKVRKILFLLIFICYFTYYFYFSFLSPLILMLIFFRI